MGFQRYLTFSQLQTKVAMPKICSIPLQANKRKQNRGVSFDFNEAPAKTGRTLNPRRNTRSTRKINETEQNTDIRLTASPSLQY